MNQIFNLFKLTFAVIVFAVSVAADSDAVDWTQLGLDIQGETGYEMASIVAISKDGKVVAVGSWGYLSYRGRVRVFKENGDGTRSQLGEDIVGDVPSGFFGWSLSLNNDGTIIAIGAHGSDSHRGLVGKATGDQYGRSLSLDVSGTIVAIGAINGGEKDGGYVQVLKWDETAWNQLGKDIDGEA
eukprot:786646_1